MARKKKKRRRPQKGQTTRKDYGSMSDISLPVPPKELKLRGAAVMKWQLQELQKQLAEKGSAGPGVSNLETLVADTPDDADPYEVYVEKDDPLRVINDDWRSIVFASMDSSFVKCRAGRNAKLGSEWTKTFFTAQRVKRWKRYPEKFDHLSPELQRERQHQMRDFHYHEVKPVDAEDAFPDGHPRGMPEYAHILPEDFEKSRRPGMLRVKKRKASKCKFRELVRRILQDGHNSIWPDTDNKFIRFLKFSDIIPGDSDDLVFPEHRPNPYGRTFHPPQLTPTSPRAIR